MSTVRCFLKGTKEEYEELFDRANVRFGEYRKGVWQVDIRLPSHIINHKPTNRFHYIKTIRGILRKLERKGLLITQLGQIKHK